MPKANILLVDDRPENLLALEAILEPLGQNLVRAHSGPEALKHLLRQDYALILLDVQMPGMDGFETAALIKEREKTRGIPIIFVTAISKDERYVFQGYAAGAVDYIRKPFDADILRSKVRVFVELYEKEQQIRRQAEQLRQVEQEQARRQQAAREHEREQAHLRELARSEAQLLRFKATLDATLDGVFIFDADSLRFSYVNQGAQTQLGFSEAELLEKTPLDVHVGLDETTYRAWIAPLVAGTQPSLTFETEHCARDGKIIPVEVFLQFIAPPGESGRFVAIVRDITERKRAQEALEALYEKERRIAETLQRSLLRHPASDDFPGLTVASFYQAAWKEASIGGDYFDAFVLRNGKVAFVSGDVSGKGLAAATRTAEVKFALRAFLRENGDAATAIARLNDFVCECNDLDNGEHSSFIVLALAVFDPQTGNVEFVVAGAESPLILRGDGTAESIPNGGLPVGVQDGMTYDVARQCLSSGDTLLMLTDGITEARNEQRDFLGYEGMVDLAQQACAQPSLDAMGLTILDGARSFAGGTLQDDACLLLMRRR